MLVMVRAKLILVICIVVVVIVMMLVVLMMLLVLALMTIMMIFVVMVVETEAVRKIREVRMKFYLPHCPVIHESAVTEKLRLIFNTSAKTNNNRLVQIYKIHCRTH